MLEGILAAGSTLSLSALICLNATEIGSALGVIDRPDGQRKCHAAPTPLIGGLAVLVPFLLLVILFLQPGLAVFSGMMLLAGGLTLVGYFDDRRGLGATLRLMTAVALVGATILLLPSQTIRTLDFGWIEVDFPYLAALAFTVVAVVGLINAVNMADGMNGIVPGSALIWALCLSAACPPDLKLISLGLAALLGVVLLFNLRGRLFLGDAGAYGLAGVFSILTIDAYNRTEALTADMVVGWYIIPVIDCLRLMASRGLRGRSPFGADRDHLHHRLEQFVPSRYVFLVYWCMVGIPSAGVMFAPERSAWFIGGVVAFYAAVIMLSPRRPGLMRRRQDAAPGFAVP